MKIEKKEEAEIVKQGNGFTKVQTVGLVRMVEDQLGERVQLT